MKKLQRLAVASSEARVADDCFGKLEDTSRAIQRLFLHSVRTSPVRSSEVERLPSFMDVKYFPLYNILATCTGGPFLDSLISRGSCKLKTSMQLEMESLGNFRTLQRLSGNTSDSAR